MTFTYAEGSGEQEKNNKSCGKEEKAQMSEV